MKIESLGIYSSNGQMRPVSTSPQPQLKAPQNTVSSSKGAPAKHDFAAMLSEAETTQLTKLFGKFDLKALAGEHEQSTEENRPGQIIDILV